MRSEDKYQILLIVSGIVAVAMFAVFLYREVFPEYKIYQENFVVLEQFRSSYSGEPPAPFKLEVKQIVIPQENKGPPIIDRCVSCHVALQIEDYSPTRIAKDINGNAQLDSHGDPIKIKNENYVWAKLDQKIDDLRDPNVIEQLRQQGDTSIIKQRMEEADTYEKLKWAQVGEHTYDVRKVLAMHPLMGKETRPFEFHPIEEYGCVSCHNGNGRGLTTEKAHGPIFDGEYEITFMGHKQHFLETDEENDPPFSRMFNDKPGEKLIFQTTPLFMGSLMEAKCVQCHQPSSKAVEEALLTQEMIAKQKEKRAQAIHKALLSEMNSLASLLNLKSAIQNDGLEAAEKELKRKESDLTLPKLEQLQAASQLKYLKENSENIIPKIDRSILAMLGSETLARKLEQSWEEHKTDPNTAIEHFLLNNFMQDSHGSLFEKYAAWNLEKEISEHAQYALKGQLDKNADFLPAIKTDIDYLTENYTAGEQLYISQACYACHRISGFARGGVGPELTYAGNNYPWYLKESIVWPQADLPSSTMPNFRLDHPQVEKLLTFLLGQTGEQKAPSEMNYKKAIQQWEAGHKTTIEKPISPAQMMDLRYAMTVYATEGCAACHRLKGFESNIGLAIEKNNEVTFDQKYKEHQWFIKLFPEEIAGSQIVEVIEKNRSDLKTKIATDVRQNSILEEIEKNAPGQIEALYSNFTFASRAKNHFYEELLKKHPENKETYEKELQEWQNTVHQVLMTYIQEYGLGRLVGPRPNWSGVFRTDQWLMEHFRNPSGHTPRSIMPVFPFDDTKFYALTYMLDRLSIQNRDAVREIWEHRGFDPAQAANIFCSQCHGEFLQGNGPVAEWIYPLPKNLRNPDFLRNMTKENIENSIIHGMPGTPMPPWGEVASDKVSTMHTAVLTQAEIKALTNWLFASVSGGEVIRGAEDVPKWQYTSQEVESELSDEGDKLKGRQKEASESLFRYTSTAPKDAAYYLKEEFYTPSNIEQGKEFFILNCAVCHGAEADGSGIRAEFMQDAKPRMLTNLDWLNVHDDLYLLRSIKYGVPGTSMTPWGDQTSSLQRLQLVIFIRSLVHEQQQRNTLLSTFFEVFDQQEFLLEQARLNQFKKVEEEKDLVETLQKQLKQQIQDEKPSEEAAKLYIELLNTQKSLEKQRELDQKYLELKTLIKDEKELYRLLGLDIISQRLEEQELEIFIRLINAYRDRYILENGLLKRNPEFNLEFIQNLFEKLIASIDREIEKYHNATASEQMAKVNNLKKLRDSLIYNQAEIKRMDQKQLQLLTVLTDGINK